MLQLQITYKLRIQTDTGATKHLTQTTEMTEIKKSSHRILQSVLDRYDLWTFNVVPKIVIEYKSGVM